VEVSGSGSGEILSETFVLGARGVAEATGLSLSYTQLILRPDPLRHPDDLRVWMRCTPELLTVIYRVPVVKSNG
jgi:hypothetical protein